MTTTYVLGMNAGLYLGPAGYNFGSVVDITGLSGTVNGVDTDLWNGTYTEEAPTFGGDRQWVKSSMFIAHNVPWGEYGAVYEWGIYQFGHASGILWEGKGDDPETAEWVQVASGDGTPPVWKWAGLVEIGNVRDVTLTLESGEADVSTRGAQGWRATAPTLRECTVEFQMVWRPNDPVFEAIKSAYLDGSPIALAVLDRKRGMSCAQGPLGDFSITNFSRNEALEEAILADVTAKLSLFREWYVSPLDESRIHVSGCTGDELGANGIYEGGDEEREKLFLSGFEGVLSGINGEYDWNPVTSKYVLGSSEVYLGVDTRWVAVVGGMDSAWCAGGYFPGGPWEDSLGNPVPGTGYTSGPRTWVHTGDPDYEIIFRGIHYSGSLWTLEHNAIPLFLIDSEDWTGDLETSPWQLDAGTGELPVTRWVR